MFGIVANVISDNALRTGAKVHVIALEADRVEVIGISKGGRKITKYIACKKLEKFRAAYIPPVVLEVSRYTFRDKGEAEFMAKHLVDVWTGVRFFHRNGVLLRDGITLGMAWVRD